MKVWINNSTRAIVVADSAEEAVNFLNSVLLAEGKDVVTIDEMEELNTTNPGVYHIHERLP